MAWSSPTPAKISCAAWSVSSICTKRQGLVDVRQIPRNQVRSRRGITRFRGRWP
jgi:hypothetical protein